jgi:hypothetical protein
VDRTGAAMNTANFIYGVLIVATCYFLCLRRIAEAEERIRRLERYLEHESKKWVELTNDEMQELIGDQINLDTNEYLRKLFSRFDDKLRAKNMRKNYDAS